MLLHFYVRQDDNEYEVGRAICPVVPRVGETYYLRMSIMAKAGIDWRLNPNSPIRHDTAYFLVTDVAYDGYNTLDVEEGMGAAAYHEGSTTITVQLYVTAKNEDTQVYVDRIIAKEKAGQVH